MARRRDELPAFSGYRTRNSRYGFESKQKGLTAMQRCTRDPLGTHEHELKDQKEISWTELDKRRREFISCVQVLASWLRNSCGVRKTRRYDVTALRTVHGLVQSLAYIDGGRAGTVHTVACTGAVQC